MTTLNLNITPTRAWLSQDLAHYFVGELPPLNVTAAKHHHRSQAAGEAQKLGLYPDKKMLVGVMGNYVHAYAFCEMVRATGRDIHDIDAVAPEVLRGLMRDYRPPTPEMIVITVGWSDRKQRVASYLYHWEQNNFASQPLKSGLTRSPDPDPEAPGYDELLELWAAADIGRDVPAFHAALHANQKWQADNGRLRAGVMLSDDYTLASVDADGARLVEAHSGEQAAIA